jgi:hypothetical protein
MRSACNVRGINIDLLFGCNFGNNNIKNGLSTHPLSTNPTLGLQKMQ